MARDYKDRGMQDRQRNRSRDAGRRGKDEGSNIRWVLIAGLVLLFIGFLGYLKFTKSDSKAIDSQAELITKEVSALPDSGKASKNTKEVNTVKTNKAPERVEPKFDYYTILPGAEVVVPDHEIKTRMREELVGKVKVTQYILQAGSFRDIKDADKLKAKLTQMHIASKIESAKVGNVIWSRVKLGPYSQLATIETLKARLRKDGIDVMITEIPK